MAATNTAAPTTTAAATTTVGSVCTFKCVSGGNRQGNQVRLSYGSQPGDNNQNDENIQFHAWSLWHCNHCIRWQSGIDDQRSHRTGFGLQRACPEKDVAHTSDDFNESVTGTIFGVEIDRESGRGALQVKYTQGPS